MRACVCVCVCRMTIHNCTNSNYPSQQQFTLTPSPSSLTLRLLFLCLKWSSPQLSVLSSTVTEYGVPLSSSLQVERSVHMLEEVPHRAPHAYSHVLGNPVYPPHTHGTVEPVCRVVYKTKVSLYPHTHSPSVPLLHSPSLAQPCGNVKMTQLQ